MSHHSDNSDVNVNTLKTFIAPKRRLTSISPNVDSISIYLSFQSNFLQCWIVVVERSFAYLSLCFFTMKKIILWKKFLLFAHRHRTKIFDRAAKSTWYNINLFARGKWVNKKWDEVFILRKETRPQKDFTHWKSIGTWIHFFWWFNFRLKDFKSVNRQRHGNGTHWKLGKLPISSDLFVIMGFQNDPWGNSNQRANHIPKIFYSNF